MLAMVIKQKSNIVFLHFFVLIQRNEAKKNQGKPDRSARFALPCHTALIIPFSSLLYRSLTALKTQGKIRIQFY
jgi:hypothetical protein